ncbi:MAG: hypothetical protein GX640_07230 [Fibrobacter sp.]|nr:hypothetical protein [Fibrobacter sp.]
MVVKRLTLSILTGVMLLFPVLSGAEEQEKGFKGQCFKMLTDLGLSEDQKTSLKEYHHEIMELRQKNHKAMREVRQQVKDELLKTNPSKEVLDGFAQKMADLHKQMAIDHNDHLLKVKSLLTPEQFSKVINCMGGQGGKECKMSKGQGKMCPRGKDSKAGPNAAKGCGQVFE